MLVQQRLMEMSSVVAAIWPFTKVFDKLTFFYANQKRTGAQRYYNPEGNMNVSTKKFHG